MMGEEHGKRRQIRLASPANFSIQRLSLSGVKLTVHLNITLLSITSGYEGQSSRGRGEGAKSSLIFSL